MKNVHSSDGIAEDMIRSFVQFGAAELHLKTLVEKSEAKLRDGLTEDMDGEVAKLLEYQKQLNEVTELRRSMMLTLFEMYDGDKDAWCLVKHLGMGMITAFEAAQASDFEPKMYELWLKANSQFTKALSEFLGTEITDCAACFADMLKGDKNG